MSGCVRLNVSLDVDMRLYKHVSRLAVRRSINRQLEKRLVWASRLKPGDLINSCTGFNERIVTVDREVCYTRHNGWFVYDFIFLTEATGCALVGCGVKDPLPRDYIENRHLEFLTNYISSGQAKTWYGLDSQKYEAFMARSAKIIETLKSGGHICDEDGRLKPEFSSVWTL